MLLTVLKQQQCSCVFHLEAGGFTVQELRSQFDLTATLFGTHLTATRHHHVHLALDLRKNSASPSEEKRILLARTQFRRCQVVWQPLLHQPESWVTRTDSHAFLLLRYLPQWITPGNHLRDAYITTF